MVMAKIDSCIVRQYSKNKMPYRTFLICLQSKFVFVVCAEGHILIILSSSIFENYESFRINSDMFYTNNMKGKNHKTFLSGIQLFARNCQYFLQIKYTSSGYTTTSALTGVHLFFQIVAAITRNTYKLGHTAW